MNEDFVHAQNEIGKDEFKKRYRKIFNDKIECLDYVETIFINLPETCYCNCKFCIDKELKHNLINDNEKFLRTCERVFKEFPHVRNISIAGGSLPPDYFNRLIQLIMRYYKYNFIIWNTNGINIDKSYSDAIFPIDIVNLHCNSIDNVKNQKIFNTTYNTMTIEYAKKLFKRRLWLRIPILEDFNIDDYISFGIPLYLNRLLPGTKETNKQYDKIRKQLYVIGKERKRRNTYICGFYKKDTCVRLCVGDGLQKHIPNRKPTYLNVVNIHRSGIVSGSWYEDDKFLYKEE